MNQWLGQFVITHNELHNKIDNRMLNLPRCQSVQYPRPKIYLHNLNQLINRKATLQPEIQVSNKLFPQRAFAKKLSLSHQRTKSNIQIRTKKFDLQFSPKKSKALEVTNNSPTNKQIRQERASTGFKRSESLQLQISNGPLTRTDNQWFSESMGVQPSLIKSQGRMQQSVSPPREFLRKGSTIQKKIVVNLLRNKLMKQRELKEKKDYSNQEILKMIQVFKGVAANEMSRKGPIRSKVQLQLNEHQHVKNEPFKQLMGWEQHQTLHDYIDHPYHSEHQNSSMILH